MKKIMMTLIAWTMGVAAVMAAPTTLEQTQRVASNFYRAQVGIAAPAPQLTYTATANDGVSTPCFYVYNIGDGFVIVSADDRVRPVLGYSTEGRFDAQQMPPAMAELLEGYRIEIAGIVSDVPESCALHRAEWQALVDGSYQPHRNVSTVDALLGDNNWQQNNGYNYYCPADNSGPGGHCYVGCCALSMGMVMHYWQHPTKGTGSHSYDCNHSEYLSGQYGDYGTLSANFGNTTYNWAAMPNHLTSSTPSNQILAVARLLSHCGIAIEMWYGNQGSMGFHDDIADALEEYFKYDECLTVWKNNYSGDWSALLKSDLDLGRPIIYCAYASEGGHEFVCDGYDANDFFHFNMGWGGSYNGFYAIDNLNAQYNFNSSHAAVAHIRPLAENPDGISENGVVKVEAFPNPATGVVTVVSSEPIDEVQLFDATGRQVRRLDAVSGCRCEVELNGLAPGLYMMRVVDASGAITTTKVSKR